jgi:hypothetical protein
MTWTPERIAAAPKLIERFCRGADRSEGIFDASFAADVRELAALARLGLAVVDPTEADVERVARAIWEACHPDGDWSWHLGDARAAIAAMAGHVLHEM